MLTSRDVLGVYGCLIGFGIIVGIVFVTVFLLIKGC